MVDVCINTNITAIYFFMESLTVVEKILCVECIKFEWEIMITCMDPSSHTHALPTPPPFHFSTPRSDKWHFHSRQTWNNLIPHSGQSQHTVLQGSVKLKDGVEGRGYRAVASQQAWLHRWPVVWKLNMLPAKQGKVNEYSGLFSQPTAICEGETDAIISASPEAKCRRG